MTRLETPFVIDGDLIIVEVRLTGPLGPAAGRFVLDTGAVATTMIPELADFGIPVSDLRLDDIDPERDLLSDSNLGA